MSEVTLIPVDPTADEVQYLEDRIYEFNSHATDIADGEPLAFFVRERDHIVAGICGNTWGGRASARSSSGFEEPPSSPTPAGEELTREGRSGQEPLSSAGTITRFLKVRFSTGSSGMPRLAW